jgi:hypothetical protein
LSSARTAAGRLAISCASPTRPFNYWSLGPSGGIDSAEPVNPQGTTTNLRWRFTCRKCGTSSVRTNGTVIAKIIAAHAENAHDITS